MAIDRTFTCVCCGKVIDYYNYDTRKPWVKKMTEDHVCFDCRLWEGFKSNPPAEAIAINGKLARFKVIREKIRKNSNPKIKISFARELKTGDAVAITDFVVISVIPKHFKKFFRDQYRFISEETYYKIMDREDRNCLMKGCYDRYNCIWYNAVKNEKYGAWNKIPDSYRPGMELCESFVNKNTIYNVDIN